MNIYSSSTEEDMIKLYKSLSEKDRRHYAAVLARKIGHGGVAYIAKLFGCSRKTIIKGINKIEEEKLFQPFRDIFKPNIENCINLFCIFTPSTKNLLSKANSCDNKLDIKYISNVLKVEHENEESSIINFDPDHVSIFGVRMSKMDCLRLLNKIRDYFSFSGIRKKGGGRKRIINTLPYLSKAFLEIISEYTAGSPVINKIKWTNLVPREIAE